MALSQRAESGDVALGAAPGAGLAGEHPPAGRGRRRICPGRARLLLLHPRDEKGRARPAATSVLSSPLSPLQVIAERKRAPSSAVGVAPSKPTQPQRDEALPEVAKGERKSFDRKDPPTDSRFSSQPVCAGSAGAGPARLAFVRATGSAGTKASGRLAKADLAGRGRPGAT